MIVFAGCLSHEPFSVLREKCASFPGKVLPSYSISPTANQSIDQALCFVENQLGIKAAVKCQECGSRIGPYIGSLGVTDNPAIKETRQSTSLWANRPMWIKDRAVHRFLGGYRQPCHQGNAAIDQLMGQPADVDQGSGRTSVPWGLPTTLPSRKRGNYDMVVAGKLLLRDYIKRREIYTECKSKDDTLKELAEEYNDIRNNLITREQYVVKIAEEFYRELRKTVRKNMCHNLCNVEKLGPHSCRLHHPCKDCEKFVKKQRPVNCKECAKNPTYCKANFPKHNRDHTEFSEDSYPNYIRPTLTESDEVNDILEHIREGRSSEIYGSVKEMKLKIDREAKLFYFGKKYQFFIDNRWVVPYNPWLIMKYRAHINVELIASIKSIKYIFKYIHKGYDQANVKISGEEGEQKVVYDEISQFQEMRYIGPTEAGWRLLGKNFPLHEKTYHVERLPVHVEGRQDFYFDEKDNEQQVINKMEQDTKLLAFFKLCDQYKAHDKNDLDNRIDQKIRLIDAEIDGKKCTEYENEIEKLTLITLGCHYSVQYRNRYSDQGVCYDEIKGTLDEIPPNSGLLYKDFPKYFTWHNETKIHHWDLRKNYFKTLGRIYWASPADSTGRYHLRILLLNVRSPRNYEDLKTYNGQTDNTFQEACLARGLIEDDAEYIKSMEEAKEVGTPSMIRNFFVILLLHCNPAKPFDLWEMFKDEMISDIKIRHPKYDEIMLYKTCLFIIYKKLINNDKVISRDYPSMPELDMDEYQKMKDNYDAAKEQAKAEEMKSKMNKEQKDIFEKLEKLLLQDSSATDKKCYFIYGPGGSGKSYVYEALWHLAMGNGKKVITTAFSGIAATILPGGMTNHKMLKMTFNLDPNSSSSIQNHMPEAELLRQADIIIWDEAPMSPKYVLDICHRKLQEIMQNNLPFGGKIMCLGGDWRQILPVKKYAVPAEIIDLCLKRSPLWKHFEVVHFVENMRANKDEKEFMMEILAIGDGTANDENNKVKIRQECIADKPLSELVFKECIRKKDWDSMAKRAILSPYNSDVDSHNQEVLNMLPGKEYVFDSLDVHENVDGVPLPEEVLRKLNIPNFSQGTLRVKDNAVVQILRNLILDKGLCNGTRLLILKILNHLLHCLIISGDKAGQRVLIPKITLIDEDHFDGRLHRKQFPVRLAFAMTINKSQGQTLDFVGIDLTRDVFSHGQLYVGVSRVRSWKNLKVMLPKKNEDNKVLNVVWKSAL